MKFIYILCNCKCKNQYIYMALHGYIEQYKKKKNTHMILFGSVKQCKCKTM
jgi:hypothetical protein